MNLEDLTLVTLAYDDYSDARLVAAVINEVRSQPVWWWDVLITAHAICAEDELNPN